MKKYYCLLLTVFFGLNANAQTMTDAVFMPKGDFCTGFFYGQSQWKNYWEGTLKRDNQNIGTVSTQSFSWMGIYGITPKINVMASLPYITTKASGGTMRGQIGIQDLSIGAKYKFFEPTLGTGKFSAIVGGSFCKPMTKYTPDFLPLSIGLASTTMSGRFTMNYRMEKGWYINASNAYTYRGNVKLDRPAYFVDNTYYASDDVKMYDQYDFNIDLGYLKNGWLATISYMQTNTLGGGDIRRQDMPFVSNQTNASMIGALVKYDFSKPKNFSARLSGSYCIAGRNVGQSTAFMAGMLYTFHFAKSQE